METDGFISTTEQTAGIVAREVEEGTKAFTARSGKVSGQ
jgi:hypothetical protein